MDRRKRALAFGLSWLAYATYYLGRKGFSVVKKPIHDLLGISEATLGRIDTAYPTAYSLGQFLSGYLGDRVGARRLIGAGMVLSAAACAAFGSARGALAFALIFAANGLAQSTGWPGTTRSLAEWTTVENRGTVMAFWSTSYQVGGFAAVWFAGSLAAATAGARFSRRPRHRGRGTARALLLPTPKTLPSPPTTTASPATATASVSHDVAVSDELEQRRERRVAQMAVVKNPTLWFFSASYACMKFIRYALLFWLPYYLATSHGYSTKLSAQVSTAFEAGGFTGVIVIGILSDRLRGLGRTGLSFLSLASLTRAFLALVLFGTADVLTNVVLLAVIGALLFGPDSLLSGAAASMPVDASRRHGDRLRQRCHSIGPILRASRQKWLKVRYGWDAIFLAMPGSHSAALVLLPALRHKTTPSRTSQRSRHRQARRRARVLTVREEDPSSSACCGRRARRRSDRHRLVGQGVEEIETRREVRFRSERADLEVEMHRSPVYQPG
jgi:sugar phosphate permease